MRYSSIRRRTMASMPVLDSSREQTKKKASAVALWHSFPFSYVKNLRQKCDFITYLLLFFLALYCNTPAKISFEYLHLCYIIIIYCVQNKQGRSTSYLYSQKNSTLYMQRSLSIPEEKTNSTKLFKPRFFLCQWIPVVPD